MTESSLALREPMLTRGRRPAALLAAGTLLLGSAAFGFIGQTANASSHREAPLIAADPAVDNTDVYAFVSPEPAAAGTVTFIASWIPFEEPNGGPNFYPWATDAYYDINIDNDGDAVADIVYRWEFFTEDLRGADTFLYNVGPVTSLDDPDLLFRQYYTLTSIDVDAATSTVLLDGSGLSGPQSAPSYTGDASMGGPAGYETLRTDAVEALPGGGQTVAAQADDPFFLDLRIFDLLYGGDLSEIGQDTLAGYNVNALELQVPQAAVALNGLPAEGQNPNIGIWSTTSRAPLRDAAGNASAPITDATAVQVSRLGMPLVNEVVVPTGLKDAFNSISPDQDATALDAANPAGRILDPEVPRLIEAIYGIPAPPAPRYDIFEVFLTGIVEHELVDVDGDPATDNPLEINLNSQAINADADPAAFQPSEMLRLNMSTPLTQAADQNRLGVVGGDPQGFPNGRRLGDDVVDIELLVLEGVTDINNIPPDRAAAGVAALAGGDGVNVNDNVFSNVFPYLSLPNTQAVNGGGGTGGGGLSPVPPAPVAGGAGAPAPVAGYPVGGVETGIGGLSAGWVPALTGSAALLLLGAGAGSLMYRRSSNKKLALAHPGDDS